MWQELQNVSSLEYVAAPLLVFKPQTGFSMPLKWDTETEYKLNLFFLGMIPFGKHFIKVITLNEAENRILSNEHGSLTKVWNHEIRFHALDARHIEYTDEIEIKAGILTLAVWLFSQVFYRHRQARWKKLLAANEKNRR